MVDRPEPVRLRASRQARAAQPKEAHLAARSWVARVERAAASGDKCLPPTCFKRLVHSVLSLAQKQRRLDAEATESAVATKTIIHADALEALQEGVEAFVTAVAADAIAQRKKDQVEISQHNLLEAEARRYAPLPHDTTMGELMQREETLSDGSPTQWELLTKAMPERVVKERLVLRGGNRRRHECADNEVKAVRWMVLEVVQRIIRTAVTTLQPRAAYLTRAAVINAMARPAPQGINQRVA